MSDSPETTNENPKSWAAWKREAARLQAVLDSRPAINAALPDSYIRWSQSIYAMEISHAQGKPS